MNPRILAALIPAVVLVAACSGTAPNPRPSAASSAVAGAPSPVSTPSVLALSGQVAVTMHDTMRYTPAPITVRAGTPITFVVTNAGLIVHEFFVGTGAEQAEHAAEMAAAGMGHHHHNAVSVKPGDTASLTMTFAESGTLLIGCHEVGHYEAGMQTLLTIAD